ALSVPSGTATLSALTVTGASTLTSASLSTTLGVTGLSTLGSLTVTGVSSLATLGVSGVSTLDSVVVTGAATAASVDSPVGKFDTLSVTSGASTVYTLPSDLGTDGQARSFIAILSLSLSSLHVLGVESSALAWVTPSSGSSDDPTVREFTVTSGTNYAGDAYSVTAGDQLRAFTDGTVHSASDCNPDYSDYGSDIGVALADAAAGEQISVGLRNHIYTGYSGLVQFETYWWNWLTHSITTTVSDDVTHHGFAYSSTEMLIYGARTPL
ncbi:hypothetical protein KIPB_003243, partial [Kipferlia bialata]